MKPTTARLLSNRLSTIPVGAGGLGTRLKRHASAVQGYKNKNAFHTSRQLAVVKPFLLADIGEGIREVQIIQWFVQPGARVEQFDKLCEVQSDKASVEITSRFDGVIKKLHYEADDMAIVGKPLVDIDIQGEISAEDEALTQTLSDQADGANASPQSSSSASTSTSTTSSRTESSSGSSKNGSGGLGKVDQYNTSGSHQLSPNDAHQSKFGTRMPSAPYGNSNESSQNNAAAAERNSAANLATPAVRHLTRRHQINIADITGTGKDGRVLKEDVQRFLAERSSISANDDLDAKSSASSDAVDGTASVATHEQRGDSVVPLTPIQAQMFKTMTRSLSIPHFLYSDSVDLTSLTSLRQSVNASLASEGSATDKLKISALAFILKATSIALLQYPILNARLDTSSNPDKPQLVHRASHNIGIAVDTPNGLVVPVIKSVQSLSVADVAAEIRRLSSLGREGRLTNADFSGGTFTVSNVGSIGGGVVSPVIVEGQTSIVGVGKAKAVPAFGPDGGIVRREECVFSWTADHRVVDGATVARCAEHVKQLLENPGRLLISMR